MVSLLQYSQAQSMMVLQYISMAILMWLQTINFTSIALLAMKRYTNGIYGIIWKQAMKIFSFTSGTLLCISVPVSTAMVMYM